MGCRSYLPNRGAHDAIGIEMSMDKIKDSNALRKFGSKIGNFFFLEHFVLRMLEKAEKYGQEAFTNAWDDLLAWSSDGEQTFSFSFR